VVKGHAYNEMLKQIESDRIHYTECDAEEIHGPIFGIPAETMNDSTGYPMAPAPGNRLNEPLPLPAAENEVPMSRVAPNSPLRNVNYSNSARAQQTPVSQTSAPRFKNQPNTIQQIGYEQPAGSKRVQVFDATTQPMPQRRTSSQSSDTGRATFSASDQAYEAARERQRAYQMSRRN
jgi:hypothetical protein